ncbi:MAG: hypothetical protein M1817_001028 [Caeruleum heppii]|nr:MAG: hypothetical protein M1817_001028 [Caeruleum heppii]
MNPNIPSPLRDLEAIADQEAQCIFPEFTAHVASWVSLELLKYLREVKARPAVIHVAGANGQVLYHSPSSSGAAPDNDIWIARKKKTVLRWGHSTWYMHVKFQGDEEAFAKKFALGDSAGEYAIHGGGFPVRVPNVDMPVGVIVVSGLKQEEDHQVIIEVLASLLRGDIKS